MDLDYEQIAALIAGVIALANAITAMTPTKTDNEIWNAISKVLNILALNVFKNKNADDTESDPIQEVQNEK